MTVTGQAESKEKQSRAKQSSLDEEETQTLQNTKNEDFSHWETVKIPETDPLENQSFHSSGMNISETIWSGSFEDLPEPIEEERLNAQLAARENQYGAQK